MKQPICPNCGGLLEAVAIGWKCKKCKGFISLQDGKFFEYVEKPFMPPKTNADRIRAMSDEELAEFLCGVYDDDNCGVYQDECGKFINGTTIIDYDQYKVAEWLKQPAETENVDRCVCCGAIIPEGQMVCPNCLVTVKEV